MLRCVGGSSGGGIGGLALAVVLGKYEQKDAPLEVNVYEARPEITTFGAGLSVWQRTWRVMQLLGMEQELSDASVRPPSKGLGERHALLLCDHRSLAACGAICRARVRV